jgi:hypothetical protein
LIIFDIDFNKGLTVIKFEIECFLFVTIKVLIGILRASFEIQFLAISYIDFKKGFNQISNFVLYFFMMVFIGILGAL